MSFNVAVLSTAYFPPIEYFCKILRYNSILIEKHETYPKQTYRNRCEIYSANGLLSLSIPVIKPNGNSSKINEILIDNSVKWRKEHWRAIESAYRSSAYFEYLRDYFYPFYEKEWQLLWEFNMKIIETLMDILEMETPINETYSFTKVLPKNISDYRFTITPKGKTNREERSVVFKPYYQVFAQKHGFMSNLSILDLICNCGMESLSYLESNYN